ncbi:hypothetical protein Pcinc_000554 [Petrolisthes cinctipes]|uniref:Uncharacterized protein n=1 Tax=Petrolisthes cinctipes TaxID=88211 RepID=A0AAE1GPB2_PETCI|nr:hypothetical protein Pcinc_000554 [Petrolisthes cinctipes]
MSIIESPITTQLTRTQPTSDLRAHLTWRSPWLKKGRSQRDSLTSCSPGSADSTLSCLACLLATLPDSMWLDTCSTTLTCCLVSLP